jgi:two-component system chemotaxis response regulator CheY
MLVPESTNRIFTRIEDKEEKGIKSEDQEQQFTDILSKFYKSEELSVLITEIKNNLGLNPSEGSSPSMVSNMILEILIEPKYLSSLERYDRTALQAKLIEKLNSLKANLDTETEPGLLKKKKSVLIVEDSKTMMDLLKDIVSEANFNVAGSVDNGQGAFEQYKSLCEKKIKPDVVLMDIFIKGLNGVEATKLIMDYDPFACIVVLTSSLDSKVKTKLTSMGVDEYLIKPVTKTQLINSLEQSLAKRKGMMK